MSETDVRGVLDIKWCNRVINGQPWFGLTNSVGKIKLYCLSTENREIKQVAEMPLGNNCLGHALDWNNLIDSRYVIKTNQSTDNTGGSIVSECRLENGPERRLKTFSFNP